MPADAAADSEADVDRRGTPRDRTDAHRRPATGASPDDQLVRPRRHQAVWRPGAVNAVDFDIPRGSIVSLIGPERRRQDDVLQHDRRRLRPDHRRDLFDGQPLVDTKGTKIRSLQAAQGHPRWASAGPSRTSACSGRCPRWTTCWSACTSTCRAIGGTRSCARPRCNREEQASDRRGMELLEFVGLERAADEWARNLPYGDQRRLEIARALATDPKLLLLDEPTAGHEPQETRELTACIRRLRAELGLTILLIEHDMRVVMGICDRITVLDYGEMIAEGTPAEVRANPAGHRGVPRPRRGGGLTMALLELDDVHAFYGAIHALRGHLDRRRRGRDRHAHRRQRRRQVDDAAHDLRAAPAAPGRDHASTASGSTALPAARDRRAGHLPVARGPPHLRAA